MPPTRLDLLRAQERLERSKARAEKLAADVLSIRVQCGETTTAERLLAIAQIELEMARMRLDEIWDAMYSDRPHTRSGTL
jgi:predicted solute-binding protein